jgi:hypothetical protein
MNAFLLTLFFLFAFVGLTNATVQRKESILIGEEKGMIEESPLWELLSQRKLEFEEYSTANRAGYGAEWQIRDGQLLLSSFIGNTAEGERGLDWLFPNAKNPIVAKWYSGTLHVHVGKHKDSILMRQHAISESLIVIDVSAGRIVKYQRYEYPENIPVLRRRARLGDGFPLDSELYPILKRGVHEEVKALGKRIELNIKRGEQDGTGQPATQPRQAKD